MSASLEKLLRDARIDLILIRIEKDPSVIEEVIRYLDSDSRSIRFNSILILGKLGEQSSSALSKLISCLEDNDWSICRESVRSIGNLGNIAEEAVSSLCKLHNNDEVSIRKEVAIALGKIGYSTEEAITCLISALKDPDEEIRVEATQSLGKLHSDSPRLISSLIESLKDRSWKVRAKALVSLGIIGKKTTDVISNLITSLGDNDWRVRNRAKNSLVSFGEEIIPSTLQALKYKNKEVRKGAIEVLGELKNDDPEILNNLTPLLTNNNEGIRGKTVYGFRDIGKASVPHLLAAIKSPGSIPWYFWLLLPLGPIIMIIGNLIELFNPFLILINLIGAAILGGNIGLILRFLIIDIPKRKMFYISGIGGIDSDLTDVIPEIIQKLKQYGLLESRMEVLALVKNPTLKEKISYYLKKVLMGIKYFIIDPISIKSKIRVEISRALGKIGTNSDLAVNILINALSDFKKEVRRATALALGDLGSHASEAVPNLIKTLNDPVPDVRWRASEALGKIGVATPEVISGLEELLHDRFDHVSVSAEFALDSLQISI